VTVGCLWCSILFNGFLRFSILKQRFCRWPLQVEASTDEQCLHGGPAGEDGMSWLGVTKSGCIAYLQLDQVGKSRKRDKYKCPSKSNASLYYIILYYILCYIILYYIIYYILYYIILDYIILYYILYYMFLLYITLHYITLYYICIYIYYIRICRYYQIMQYGFYRTYQ
jgi:hypothetical protein